MADISKTCIYMRGIESLPLYTEEDGETNFDFNIFIPMPESLDLPAGSPQEYCIRAYLNRKHRKPITKEECRGMQYLENEQLYGYQTWYEWRNASWGTKSNAFSTEIHPGMISFETAWKPPIPVIYKLAEVYKDRTIFVMYASEYKGLGTGTLGFIKGTCIDRWNPPDDSEDAVSVWRDCWNIGEVGLV